MRDRTSEEYKKAIVRKLACSPLSQRQFALAEGIAFSTLHKWKTQYRVDTGEADPPVKSLSDDWTPEEKFAVVFETATLNEIEFGEYCRHKGIYPEHVMVWKQACIQANMKNSEHKKQIEADSKADKKRIRALEKELARKEKALAEAAALLVLRKKLDALWDEKEED